MNKSFLSCCNFCSFSLQFVMIQRKTPTRFKKRKLFSTVSTPLSCYLRALSSNHISIKTFMAFVTPQKRFSFENINFVKSENHEKSLEKFVVFVFSSNCFPAQKQNFHVGVATYHGVMNIHIFQDIFQTACEIFFRKFILKIFLHG